MKGRLIDISGSEWRGSVRDLLNEQVGWCALFGMRHQAVHTVQLVS